VADGAQATCPGWRDNMESPLTTPRAGPARPCRAMDRNLGLDASSTLYIQGYDGYACPAARHTAILPEATHLVL
jgi:hypothetical protein